MNESIVATHSTVSSDSIANPNRFEILNLGVWIISFGVAAALTLRDSTSALYVLAGLFGWTQVASPCGLAIIGTLTTIYTDAKQYASWCKASLMFTLAGLLSATFVGTALALVGQLAGIARIPLLAPIAVALVGSVFALREFGVIEFPLPQVCKPSVRHWRQFGLLRASLSWGLHIGFGFATFANYGGVFALMAIAACDLTGQGLEGGAMMMGCYWLGRAASVWTAPFISGDGTTTASLLRQIMRVQPVLRRLHGVALAGLVGISVHSLIRSL